MIGRLEGTLVHRDDDHVVLDVRGVGYVVQVSGRTLAGLPGAGEAVVLWTELLVREDALTLVGFPTLHEKDWFRLLTTVQGVGAKAAMSILSTLGSEATARALSLGDWTSVRAAPGIGPKLAQRVVMELNDKAPLLMAGAGREPAATRPPLPRGFAPGAAPPAGASSAAEALSALANLGYLPAEAAGAVAAAQGAAPDAATPALIRAALKLLAPKG